MDAKKIEDDFTLAGTYMDSELSEDDIKLLAELDAIDVSTAEMAVEFTDHDLVLHSTSPHQLDTRSAIYIRDIK